jgi:phenylpropionate dioxygenase-like ring-hydroxylating dioxygenase large terminal subunit
MPAPAWSTPRWWDGTRASLATATGLDPVAYTDPRFYANERSRVFERAWVCIGNAADVAQPGRLLVRRLGSRSILVTRSHHDGRLRGFLNSCRHRGTELAERDCDVANTIRCPYHRWGYGTDGRLVSTPLFEQDARDVFDPADLGLVEVRVDSWGCLLFACLDASTPPLDAWLGDLPDRVGSHRLGEWEVRESRQLEIHANWKLIAENFQEYYHLAWVHPQLAKVSRVDDHHRDQGPGMYCGQATSPVSSDTRDDWLRLPAAAWLDDDERTRGRFISVFPNVLLSVLPNHAFVMRLDPTAPGHTIETCTWLTPATPTPAASAESMSPSGKADFGVTRDFWLDVNAEDIDIVERGQRGLEGGAIPAGPLSPRFEEPLHRFHNMLADAMTLGTMADLRVPVGDDDQASQARSSSVADSSAAGSPTTAAT